MRPGLGVKLVLAIAPGRQPEPCPGVLSIVGQPCASTSTADRTIATARAALE